MGPFHWPVRQRRYGAARVVSVGVLIALLVLPVGNEGPAPHRWAPGPPVGLGGVFPGRSLPGIPPAGGLESSPAGAGSSLPAGPQTLINPTAGWSHEPAPMGISDVGVTGTGRGAAGYAYSTPAFEGTATIHDMKVTIGASEPIVAFELNAVIVLQWGGANYTYWIQNGLHVDTRTNEFTIGGAYVWNFSGSGARFGSGEVDLNNSSGSATGVVYFIPGKCGVYPGQCSTLTYPTTLTSRINVSSDAGVPRVTYQYDLGGGWVTYDWARFPHLTGARVAGFVVDGFRATPISAHAYYDAEWVWVGAGGGTSSSDVSSNLSMFLAFWNGENYQAVPTAWNFGTNTGESAGNVLDRATGAPGVPGADLTAGNGTLGVLYNRTSVGALNVTVPGSMAGQLRVDGAAYRFNGTGANFTLEAGNHTVSLENYSNSTVPVVVAGGRTTRLNLSGAGSTVFEAEGLPSATTWGLTVDGVHRTSEAPTIAFALANGTHAVSYDAVAGFRQNATDVSQVVVPVGGAVVVRWDPFTYRVPVTELGLPEGTPWWVNVSGYIWSGSGSTLNVSAPNGSTPFTVGSEYRYVATPTAGWINVSGGAVLPVTVEFGYRLAYIAGTVTPSNASLTLDGKPIGVDPEGAFNTSVLPGTYTLNATAPGFSPDSRQVVATPGNVTSITVSLQPAHSDGGQPGPNGGGNSSTGGTISTGSSTPPDALLALAAVAAIGVGVVAAVLYLRRGRAG